MLITRRDALKQDLDASYLSNAERLKTAHEIDELNVKIKTNQ